jgi:hypothetical protein
MKIRNAVCISLSVVQMKYPTEMLKSRNLIKSRKVAPLAKKKEKNESVKPVNYTLYNLLHLKFVVNVCWPPNYG